MKLTVLMDNNTFIDEYYLGEPAVSYYIEDEESKILFDAGYSDAFIKNAEAMGIDLSSLTHIVISHGHDDHTRGLRFLADSFNIKNMKLIAHPDCFLPKTVNGKYVGSPFSAAELLDLTETHLTAGVMKITENLYYLGEIPRETEFEALSPIGTTEKCGCTCGDYLTDDTALAYKTERGIFVITGCSHSGICNIIRRARKICLDDRVIGVIGGFHLFEDDEQLKNTISELESYGMKYIYPCHCVSLKAKIRMAEKLPLREVGVGMKLEI